MYKTTFYNGEKEETYYCRREGDKIRYSLTPFDSDEVQPEEPAKSNEEEEKGKEGLKPYCVEVGHNGNYSREYYVYNVPEEWTEYDLINFCDSCNFGGYVCSRIEEEHFAHVQVYTD